MSTLPEPRFVHLFHLLIVLGLALIVIVLVEFVVPVVPVDRVVVVFPWKLIRVSLSIYHHYYSVE